MKLLSKSAAESKIKQDNDELIDTNIRLRKYEGDIVHRLNTIKENYEPDKLQKLRDFENFCKDILMKKSKLLEELNGIERQIEQKKELYYNLIQKQDLLDEKVYQIEEASKKLDLREAFITDLEKKWRER
ncbi:MAG: hypothetical protein AAB706_00835 [Patescibacteria group bacterium]